MRPRPVCLIAGWMVALATGCAPTAQTRPGEHSPGLPVDAVAPTLVSGDLVFRRGRSLLSRAVLTADGGSSYSHVGLVRVSAGVPLVVHALPPEDLRPGVSHGPGDPGGVLAEPFSEFLAPARATAAAIYRLRDGERAGIAARAAEAAYRRALRGTPFDSRFDLATEDSVYCTELVWRAFREAGLDVVDGHMDSLSIPLARDRPYILPGRLLASRHFIRIRTLGPAL